MLCNYHAKLRAAPPQRSAKRLAADNFTYRRSGSERPVAQLECSRASGLKGALLLGPRGALKPAPPPPHRTREHGAV